VELEHVLGDILCADKSVLGNGKVSIPLFVRPRELQHFHFPKHWSTPIIMIGPGTGVAPFRGFLQRRKRLAMENVGAQFGEARLFFGCRRSDRYYVLLTCDPLQLQRCCSLVTLFMATS